MLSPSLVAISGTDDELEEVIVVKLEDEAIPPVVLELVIAGCVVLIVVVSTKISVRQS